MSSDIKLLPCPFCGGKAHKRIAFPCDADGMEMNLYIVGCGTCDIEFSWLWDEEVAIELWNTRKPMDRIVEDIKKFAECNDECAKTFYQGMGCKACVWNTIMDLVRKGWQQ